MLYPIGLQPAVNAGSPTPLIPVVRSSPETSFPPLPGDTFTPSSIPAVLAPAPPNWQDRVIGFLPLITLPIPTAADPSAPLPDRLLKTGVQWLGWLRGSAGAMYRQAVEFFTGQPPTPPQWLNPAHFPTGNPLRQQVVAVAHRYLGVPYVWGGEDPSGFDCSGLIQYVYKKVGISLPRTAATQARVGIPVFSRADLQAGDAVFLRGTRGRDPRAITHVGLYIGNGQVLVAPYTGARVRIESINEGKWVSKYAGARRYIV